MIKAKKEEKRKELRSSIQIYLKQNQFVKTPDTSISFTIGASRYFQGHNENTVFDLFREIIGKEFGKGHNNKEGNLWPFESTQYMKIKTEIIELRLEISNLEQTTIMEKENFSKDFNKTLTEVIYNLNNTSFPNPNQFTVVKLFETLDIISLINYASKENFIEFIYSFYGVDQPTTNCNRHLKKN